MTTWRDGLHRVVLPDGRKLIGASFRGVPFFVATGTRAGGRRIVTHDFPLRDDPHVEDLGRVARTFTIDGYVLGSGYVAERDALLSALEDKAGPGELVHPYHGIRRAICSTVSVQESIADGGMAQFAITFQDAPDRATVPIDSVDFVERVNKTADQAKQATDDEFQALYDVAGLPGFALASARDTIAAMGAGLAAAAGPVTLTTQELARLTAQTDLLVANAASLATEPAAILDSFVEALTTLVDSVADPLSVLAALIAAYDTPVPPAVSPTTATRARELANEEAIQAGLKRMVAIESVRKCSQIVFESIEQAIETRDGVTDRLDEQLGLADTIAYPGLLELRAALVSAIPSDTAHARVLTIEQPVAISAVLMSYRLYGTTDQNLDLVARNHARYPAFMAGTLQALSDL